MSDATERATEIGTTHGRTAGEAWLPRQLAGSYPERGNAEAICRAIREGSLDEWYPPLPDRYIAARVLGMHRTPPLSELCNAYEAAFRAAVTETVREATR